MIIKKFFEFVDNENGDSSSDEPNVLYFNEPYCLHIGENLKFTGMYVKGKKPKTIFDYRPCFVGETSNKEYILIVSEHPFFGVHLDFSSFDFGIKRISDEHIKLKNYNYYFKDNDPSKIYEILDLWKSKDPKLPYPGNGIITQMSRVKGYTYSYKMNGKTW